MQKGFRDRADMTRLRAQGRAHRWGQMAQCTAEGVPWGLGRIAITLFESGVAGGAGPRRSSIGAHHLGTLLPTWPHSAGKVRSLGWLTLPFRCQPHLLCQLCLDPPATCSRGSALCLTSRPLHPLLQHLEHPQVPSPHYPPTHFMLTRRLPEFCSEYLDPSLCLHRSLDFILPNG